MSQLLTTYLLRNLARPRYLSGKRGTGYLATFASIGDEVGQDALDARSETSPQDASPRALAAIARNDNDRTYRREPVPELRKYLLRILSEKQKAGTVDGLKAQFARLGCPVIEVVTELDLRNAGVVGGFGGNIGFFFIIVRQPAFARPLSPVWDGGSTWDDGVTLWGTSLTFDDLAEIENVIRRWKPAGTSCRFILFDDDGSTAWGPAGITGSYDQIPINEAWEHLPPLGIVNPYYNVSYLTP